MRRRWRWIAAVLIVLGGVGLGYYLPPGRIKPAPHFIQVRFPGTYSLPGTLAVPAAGRYAIWATGCRGSTCPRPEPSPDASRCRVITDAGRALPMSAPKTTVEYTAVDEDDAVYTWIAGFTAPAPGTYIMRCTTDPDSGGSFGVSSAPSMTPVIVGRSLSLAILFAGVVIAVVTVITGRRRRRTPGCDRPTEAER